MQAEQFTLFAEIEDRHWWFVARQEIITEIVEILLPSGKGGKVVDIGCGSGGILAGLSAQYDCIGIDTSQDAIRVAQEKHPHVRFDHTLYTPTGLKTHGDTDVFLLLDVLEHIEDDRTILKEIVENMKPGAYLVIAVPADMKLWSPHDVSVGHFRRYGKTSLASVWDTLPVDVRFLGHFNCYLYPFIRMARVLCRRRRKEWGVHGTDFTSPPAPVNALLRCIFRWEKRRIQSAFDGKKKPFKRGVSLLAVLRRV